MYFAIGLAVVVAIIVGMLWYSPLMLGEQWVHLAHPGKRADQLNFKSTDIALAMVGHIFTMIFYYYLRVFFGVQGIEASVKLALAIVGICIASESVHVPFHSGSWTLFLINKMYSVLVFMFGAMVIAILA